MIEYTYSTVSHQLTNIMGTERLFANKPIDECHVIKQENKKYNVFIVPQVSLYYPSPIRHPRMPRSLQFSPDILFKFTFREKSLYASPSGT